MDSYSLHIPSAHKKITTITYTASIIETVVQQEPLQTTPSKTITIHYRTITDLHQPSSATIHSKTIQPSTDTTTATAIASSSSISRATPTDTRTSHTASILYTSRTTIPATILHHIEVRRQKTQVNIKTFVINIYFHMDYKHMNC